MGMIHTGQVQAGEISPASTDFINGAASGYKIARGVVTPEAAAEDVVTGLTTVVAAIATLEDNPHTNCAAVTVELHETPGTITLDFWKPDLTTGASANWTLTNWIAIGT